MFHPHLLQCWRSLHSEPFCGAIAAWVLLQNPSACLEQLEWGSPLQQPAGAIYTGQRVLIKALGLWELPADLGLLTPSCYWHPIHSCNVALSHVVQRSRAGGCGTGSALRRCLLPHVSLSEHGLLGALGLRATRFRASQASSRDGLLFVVFSVPSLLS